jgi:hypothetical protein
MECKKSLFLISVAAYKIPIPEEMQQFIANIEKHKKTWDDMKNQLA